MLDLIPITIDDELLSRKKDVGHLLSPAMKNSNDEYGVFIAAPKLFNLNSTQGFPILVAVKENSEDNRVMQTLSHGHLIITHIETGQLFIVRTLPQPKQAAKREVKYPPDFVSSKQTSYYFRYRDLSTNELPQVNGTLSIFEHSGNFKSNTITVNTTISSKKPEQPNSDQQQSKIDAYDILFKKPMLTADTPCIKIANQDTIKTKNNIPVEINFTVKETRINETDGIWMHILLSGARFKKMRHVSIHVPHEQLTKHEKLVSGNFSLNMANFFYRPESKDYDLHENFFLTAVSGSEVSEIIEIEVEN